MYLREHALIDAETWALEHPDELSPIDQEYLENCLEVRAQEQAVHEAAERERQLKLEAAQQLAEAEKRRAEEQAKAAARLRRRAYVLGLVLHVAIAMAALAFVGQKAAARQRGNCQPGAISSSGCQHPGKRQRPGG